MAKNKKYLKFIVTIVAIALIFGFGAVLVVKTIDKIEHLQYPQKYSEFVEKYSAERNIDPNFVYAIIKTESGFDPQAVSSVNAIGLMQLTDETFEWIKLKNFKDDETVFKDLFDPETNIHYGVYYLSRCYDRYGDMATAAAAYHSGWGTVDKLLLEAENSDDGQTLKNFPFKQMKHYVYKVDKNYNKYNSLYGTSEE